ncbi:unnamed protein product [Ilex paraguariensis]|uniref:UDP-glucose iridoid glucosyltransferase-like n=1 Tax=Ilex paraguariensis TaxID=185542 RepID=A0ABC8SPH1_9AQUA
MGKQSTKRSQRVLLIPGPFQGHITPMLELGTTLHSKGFSITVAHTIFNSPNPSNHPDFVFLPLSDNLSGADISSRSLIALMKTINTNCQVPLRESLAQIMENPEPYDQVVCIIYDTIMPFAEAVANHLQLPSIILRTNSVSATIAYESLPRLQAAGYIPLQDYMLQDLVPGLQPLRFKDLPISKFGTLKESLEMIADISHIGTSSAIIWNSVDCLEPSALAQLKQHSQVPLFTIGPLHKMAPASSTSLIREDTNCTAWLDKQAPDSVIYVSLGSLALMDEKELAETAWGLANSGQPFLWVVRPGSVHGSEWIENLPEGFKEAIEQKGHIVKWAPQREVLSHGAVGVFWSHCGWNSTLESICEGVPMICKPYSGDQKVNARYLTEVWKVGLPLEGVLERGEIERAIRRLLVDKEGEEMRQRATDMREKLKLSLKRDGSSNNSLNDLTEFILSLQLPK